MARLSLVVVVAGLVTLSSPAPAANPAPASASMQIAGPVLMVADLERSIKFYTDGLGLTLASRLPGNPGPGAIVVGPGTQPPPFILLRQRERNASSTPPVDVGTGLSRIMLNVPDVGPVSTRLKAAGYDVPPLNGRHIFFVTDPDGYRYEVMQTSRRP